MNFNLLYRRSVTYQELEGVLDSSIHHRLLQCTSNQPVEEGIFIVRIYCRFVKRAAHCKGRVHVLKGSHSLISRTL